MKTIPLTQGQFAIVDDDDYEWLCQWKWHAVSSQRSGMYAVRQSGPKKRRVSIPMHRQILGLVTGDSRLGDHINCNTLDNRRCNLRVVSAFENAWNSKISKRNTSGYKGVSWKRRNRKWAACYTKNRKNIHLGLFDTKEEAFQAYCCAVQKERAGFARI